MPMKSWIYRASACAMAVAALCAESRAEPLSKNSDMLGVQLGMSEKQALEVLRPSATRGTPLQIGLLEFGRTFVLKSPQRDAMEQETFDKAFPQRGVTLDNGAAVDAMFAPRDNVRVLYKIDADRHPVVGISRDVKYVSRKNPLGSVLAKALSDKYGRPLRDSQAPSGRLMVWVNDGRKADFCFDLMDRLMKFEGNYQILMMRGQSWSLDDFERRGGGSCGVVMRVWMNVMTQNDEVIQFTQELMDIGEMMEGVKSYKDRNQRGQDDAMEQRRREHMGIQPKL